MRVALAIMGGLAAGKKIEIADERYRQVSE
jgi:hypothetical protein